MQKQMTEVATSGDGKGLIWVEDKDIFTIIPLDV